MRTFLLEVGCEEIPAAMLPDALEDLRARLLEALGGAEGLGGTAEPPAPFGGPRRLVAVITGIRDREEDRVIRVTGPPVSAAWDARGEPTRAALGFAKAQGVDVGRLTKVRGEKGEVVAADRKSAGRTAREVLAEACPRILAAMRFPKMMRWGDRGYCFVRPVHWIVALLDGETVDFEFMGVRSGRRTRGHRFLAPGPHELASAADYEEVLRGKGRIIPRSEERRRRIVEDRDRAAGRAGWQPREDEGLLRELVFLSESPGVITGSFPADLLDLPEPVLVTAMKHHQKYFPAQTADGRLAPGFFAVVSVEDDAAGTIRRGNEWVLKARLADARFFWQEDRKRPLSGRVGDLARITFMEKLGSLLARAGRMEALAARLADDARLPEAGILQVRQAARLAKADLTTGMVGEFPELQGIMGGIYARSEGLPGPVARAIEEHYLPVSPAGPVPATAEGCLVALADKIDLLAGCFAVGLTPKGSADPYGLRRAAHGVCRLLASPAVTSLKGRLLLGTMLTTSLSLYEMEGIQASAEAVAALREFLSQRLRFLLEEEGTRFDTARAVLAAGLDDVQDVRARAAALTALRGRAQEADFLSLATSAKRIRNILSQAKEKGLETGADVDASRLVDAEEKELHRAVADVAARIEERVGSRDYAAALKAIASLRPQVDRFFDKVLVMTPDADLRRNRLALLAGLSLLLQRVADFSEIVVEGEMVGKGA